LVAGGLSTLEKRGNIGWRWFAVLFFRFNASKLIREQTDEKFFVSDYTAGFGCLEQPRCTGSGIWPLLLSILGCNSVSAISAAPARFSVFATI
jgi:hypothetical protein